MPEKGFECTKRPGRKGFPLRGKGKGQAAWVRAQVDALSGLRRAFLCSLAPDLEAGQGCPRSGQGCRGGPASSFQLVLRMKTMFISWWTRRALSFPRGEEVRVVAVLCWEVQRFPPKDLGQDWAGWGRAGPGWPDQGWCSQE